MWSGVTDACVLAVLFSLFDYGIAARVIPTLCWSARRGCEREAIAIMRRQFGELMVAARA